MPVVECVGNELFSQGDQYDGPQLSWHGASNHCDPAVRRDTENTVFAISKKNEARNEESNPGFTLRASLMASVATR